MPGRRKARHSWSLATLGLVLCLQAGAVQAQQTGLDVTVDYIAGANIYLRAGTDQGIATDDTLFVSREDGGEYLGAFLVISSTADRSVVVFAGDPFPVTRGTVLHLTFTAGEPVAGVRPAGGVAAPGRSAAGPTYGPQASGRLAFEVNALQSRTQFQSNTLEQIDRTFATPSVALRARVTDLPGGLSFNTNLRASYRYSSPEVVQPTQTVRIYQASLEKSFEGAPVQMQLGRFYSPFETYSGYWDGLLVHFGDQGFGGGFAAGFEPDRADEQFSADLPKVTAFLNYRLEGEAVRYSADLSFHQVRPRNEWLTHTFVGWSQRVQLGRASLSQDLQVDRDPETGRWAVTRLQLRTSAPLAKGVDVHARYSLRQPYFLWSTVDVISFRRDQGGVGIGYFGSKGTFGVDVTANRFDNGGLSYTYSSSFSILQTSVLGLGLSGFGSYWTQEGAKALQWSAGVNRTFGEATGRAAYQQYRTEFATSVFLTRAVDLSLVFPLGRGVRSTVTARTQWGENLITHNVYLSIWTSF